MQIKTGMIFFVLLLSVPGIFALKEANPQNGNQVNTENGKCEYIFYGDLREGETKEIILNSEEISITFKGVKVSEGRDGNILEKPFAEKGETIPISSGKDFKALWEVDGNLLNPYREGFQLAFGVAEGINVHSRPDMDSIVREEERLEEYQGSVSLVIDEFGTSKDCEGYMDKDVGNLSAIEQERYYKPIKIEEGWNLIPKSYRIHSCSRPSTSPDAFCDSSPTTYYFDQVKKKFHHGRELRNYEDKLSFSTNEYFRSLQEKIQERTAEASGFEDPSQGVIEFEDMEFMTELLSERDTILNTIDPRNDRTELVRAGMWVHSDKIEGGHLIDSVSPRLRDMNRHGIPLFKGWNLQYVFPELIFEYKSRESPYIETRPVSLQEVKGSCEIEGAYEFNERNQEWKKLSLNKSFKEEDLHQGLAIKVTENCRLGNPDNR